MIITARRLKRATPRQRQLERTRRQLETLLLDVGPNLEPLEPPDGP